MDIEQEYQVMIQLEGICEQEQGDLMDKLLIYQPASIKKASQGYDYRPAPIQSIERAQQMQDSGDMDVQFCLKISNNSTKTMADVQQQVQITKKQVIEKPVVKKCNCSKTRCLKNYCECFRVGRMCGPQCQCVGCCNRDKLFLDRSDHHHGKCKCKKNHCLKNYCECHSDGRKCGPQCQCTQCENGKEVFYAQKKYIGFLPIDSLISFNI